MSACDGITTKSKGPIRDLQSIMNETDPIQLIHHRLLQVATMLQVGVVYAGRWFGLAGQPFVVRGGAQCPARHELLVFGPCLQTTKTLRFLGFW